MDKMEVTSRKEAFYNSIDRKVYNVGKDIQRAIGSASDLRQNIPSVQVDIEGNVSLRGNESVLILIDGKTSALMGANRAAVLEQMPADAIDKIEVITNPPAKYRPDGTAGIINSALKKKRDAGISTTVRVNVGNERRYHASILANYNPGKYHIFGSYSLRQDDRERTSEDPRTHFDAATNTTTSTEQQTDERQRPLSHIAQGGGEYKIDNENTVGASVNYHYRGFTRYGTEVTRIRAGQGVLTSDYDRQRTDPEFEKDVEYRSTYQHPFPHEGHELNVEFKYGDHREQENNYYANVYRNEIDARNLGFSARIVYVGYLYNSGRRQSQDSPVTGSTRGCGLALGMTNGAATVTVANTGPGIPPERRPALFERFYRLDSDRNRDTGGSGLGLSLCREIVTAHGGTITLAWSDGEWTEFVVRLPALAANG